jgi:hypothetical protein
LFNGAISMVKMDKHEAKGVHVKAWRNPIKSIGTYALT